MSLRRACTFNGNTTELVTSSAMTLVGSPVLGAMGDGTQGLVIDAISKRANRTIDPHEPNGFAMGCRIKTLVAMNPSSTEDHTFLRIRGLSSGNYAYLKYRGADATKGLVAGMGGDRGGTFLNSPILTVPNLTLGLGDVFDLAVICWRPADDPTGNYSLGIAINGWIVTARNDILPNHLPRDVRDWIIGGLELSGGLESAMSIIQSAWYIEVGNRIQPREIRKLAQRALVDLPKAVGRTTVFQPEYEITGYEAVSFAPWLVKHVDRQHRPIATNNSASPASSEMSRATDETGAGFGSITVPSPDGTRIFSVWTHDGEAGEPDKYISCCTNGKVWRALYSEWPNPSWTQVLTLAEADTQIINRWGHHTLENHVILLEYKANNLAPHRFLHSTDAGATYSVEWTLPQVAGQRDHFHGAAVNRLTRKLVGSSGDHRVSFFEYDIDTKQFEFIGGLDHTHNAETQGTPAIAQHGWDGKVRWDGSDHGAMPTLLIGVHEDDLHPWEGSGTGTTARRWSKRMFQAGMVSSKWTTCFALGRMHNGTLILSTTPELGGTMSVFLATPDGMVMVRAADFGSNDWHGFNATPNFIWGASHRFAQGAVVQRRDETFTEFPQPEPGRVRQHFNTGAGTLGTSVLPSPDQVLTDVQYGADGEFVGEMVTSDVDLQQVLDNQQIIMQSVEPLQSAIEAARSAVIGELDEVRLHGDLQWSGGSGSGTGNIPVNHSTGGPDAMRIMSNGQGVNKASIKAYLKSELDTNPAGAVLRGETFTNADGRWHAPLMLDEGLTYVLVIFKPRFISAIVEITLEV